MTKTFCDACKKEFVPVTYPSAERLQVRIGCEAANRWHNYDICEYCQKKIQNFVEKGYEL